MVRVTRAGQGRELLGHPYPLAPSGWADAGQPSGGDPAGEAAPGQVAINPSLPHTAQLAPPRSTDPRRAPRDFAQMPHSRESQFSIRPGHVCFVSDKKCKEKSDCEETKLCVNSLWRLCEREPCRRPPRCRNTRLTLRKPRGQPLTTADMAETSD